MGIRNKTVPNYKLSQMAIYCKMVLNYQLWSKSSHSQMEIFNQQTALNATIFEQIALFTD